MKTKDICWDEIPKTLLFKQDCTLPPPDEGYFEIGETRVVHSPIGAYREAAAKEGSRFGYRFPLRQKGKYHLLVIRYPDNASRYMCIQNGTNYDMNVGITTGINSVPTQSIHTVYSVYVPRWTDESIVFTSHNTPMISPAAICSFEVYELDELPEVELPEACYEPGMRTLGMQYEDPCNIGSSEGAMDFDDSLERHVAFMKFSGQNRLVYPIAWYHGPITPVQSQPHSRFNVLTAEDRKMYWRATFDTPDWLEKLLTRFDKEGFRFTGSMTLMRLGNLFSHLVTDVEAVRAGADTVGQVAFDGTLQLSTNDWTPLFNPIVFPSYLKHDADGTPISYAYGEKPGTGLTAPIFNPLHPEVQKQVLTYIDEIATKYAHHPSFEGISINMWHGTLLWFGNLLLGYDDLTFSLFEQETGIAVGAEATDPERFSKRYAFVMEKAKERFVAWRCEKVLAFVRAIRDTLCRVRADLKLGLTFWNETSMHGYLPGKGHLPSVDFDEGSAFGNITSLYDIYREGGMDLALLGKEEGIELSVEHTCARDSDRHWRPHRHEDFAFLDTKTAAALREGKCSAGFNFNSWIEIWGNHKVFPCDANDQNLPTIQKLRDFAPDILFCDNGPALDDPEGLFFFKYENRICSCYPTADGFTEFMSMDLSQHDALSVTAGGISIDKAHAEAQLAFAKEYRRLPAVRFTDFPTAEGPVTARYYFDGEKTYIYAVNREPYALPVTLKTDKEDFSFTLAPFMLKTIVKEGRVSPHTVCGTPSDAVKSAYRETAKRVFDMLDGETLPDSLRSAAAYIKARLSDALEDERYDEVRHLLNTYVTRKAAGLGVLDEPILHYD